jgi:hypothetical protein
MRTAVIGQSQVRTWSLEPKEFTKSTLISQIKKSLKLLLEFKTENSISNDPSVPICYKKVSIIMN